MKVRSALFVGSLLAAALSAPDPALGQSSLDSVLVGVGAVDAKMSFGYWDEKIVLNGGPSESEMRSLLDARFTLELRKLGLVVSPSASNELICELGVQFRGANQLTPYSATVALHEWVAHPRRANGFAWVIVWHRGSIASTGFLTLRENLESAARFCAESFGNAWLSMNPRR